MKKNLLITLFSLVLQVGFGQHSIYLGLYTTGHIEQYTAIATAPYYIELNYYTISFVPKMGYQYKKMTLGCIGSYTFHKNTFQHLESTLGVGYFLKYHFGKGELKHIPLKWLKQPIPIQWFAEWRQIVTNGYYQRVPDWRMRKVSTQTNFMSLQVGGDFCFGKSFSLAIGTGVGAMQFLKDAQNPAAGKRYSIRPHGTVTYQYHFKL
jgi:hypothetical protein